MILNRSNVSIHGQRYRRLAARNGKTENVETGVRVFLYFNAGCHARYSRRRLGTDDVKKVRAIIQYCFLFFSSHSSSTTRCKYLIISTTLHISYNEYFNTEQEQRWLLGHVQRTGFRYRHDDRFPVSGSFYVGEFLQ